MCNKNVPQAQMHSEFEHILQEITPDQSLLALAKEITAHAYNEKYAYIQQQKKDLQTQIQNKNQLKEKVFDVLLQSNTSKLCVINTFVHWTVKLNC